MRDKNNFRYTPLDRTRALLFPSLLKNYNLVHPKYAPTRYQYQASNAELLSLKRAKQVSQCVSVLQVSLRIVFFLNKLLFKT